MSSDNSKYGDESEEQKSISNNQVLSQDEEIEGRKEQKSKKLNKNKEHFFSKDLQKDLETVKLRPYPKSEFLEQIYNNYKKIQNLQLSSDEILLRLEEEQFVLKQKQTIIEVKALKKERDGKFYKYLKTIRNNFVNEELFGNLRKKRKLINQDIDDQRESDKSSNQSQKEEKLSDEDFSHYSEFY